MNAKEILQRGLAESRARNPDHLPIEEQPTQAALATRTRLYPLSISDIQMAGAAMDFVLNNPQLTRDVTPRVLADLQATRDLFEQFNSENYLLFIEAPSTP